MKMIDKEHLENMRKREETIEKVYKEKAHYLDEVETKEDAFREGINAAMQVLNLHLVSKTVCGYFGECNFKGKSNDCNSDEYCGSQKTVC